LEGSIRSDSYAVGNVVVGRVFTYAHAGDAGRCGAAVACTGCAPCTLDDHIHAPDREPECDGRNAARLDIHGKPRCPFEAAAQSIYRGLAVRGADVTVFDYRGYGFSPGKPAVIDFRSDSLAIYDKLAASGPVIVYGFSLGTAMATYVASQRPVAGLILAGTIATAKEEFPIFGRATGYNSSELAKMMPSPDAVTAFDETGMIAKNSSPLLMIHGESDQLVPIQEGREVFSASTARQKQFVVVSAAGHNDTVESVTALAAVRSYLSSLPADKKIGKPIPEIK